MSNKYKCYVKELGRYYDVLEINWNKEGDIYLIKVFDDSDYIFKERRLKLEDVELFKSTGFKDKKGKEVYENHKVRFEFTAVYGEPFKLKGIVVYDEDSLSYKISVTNHEYFNCFGFDNNQIKRTLEVIGFYKKGGYK